MPEERSQKSHLPPSEVERKVAGSNPEDDFAFSSFRNKWTIYVPILSYWQILFNCNVAGCIECRNKTQKEENKIGALQWQLKKLELASLGNRQ